MIPTLLALKVLILAGGGAPAENYHSHEVHVRALADAVEARGVPRRDVVIFWADGNAPGPDEAVVQPEDEVRDDWLLEGTSLDRATRVGPRLLDTRFPGYEVRPAKRRALKEWLAREGSTLAPGDTLLLAVTDHGQQDPDGGWNSRISLWGESWSAKDLIEDLAPVPDGVRVQLWMSQCFGGGFAHLHLERDDLCGAFATGPDRPAYGCFAELAGRDDVGHFLRFLSALSRSDSLAGASDEAMLTDDTPDTPNLTSDAYLYELVSAEAGRRGQSVSAFVDAHLAQVPADAPERALARKIATRYGLGEVPDHASVEAVLRNVDDARFALDQWTKRWEGVLAVERARLVAPFKLTLARDAAREARLAARRGLVAQLKAALVKQPDLDSRLATVHDHLDRADELRAVLDEQEAAALRIAYLYGRLAGPAVLSGPARDHLDALRACESHPVLGGGAAIPAAARAAVAANDPVQRPPTVGAPVDPPAATPLPPLDTVLQGVAALRPGYLGVTYADGPQGADVTAVRDDGPGGAAGVRAGDRLVSVDGAPLDHKGALAARVALDGAGRVVRFAVLRAGQSLTLPVTLAAMPLPPKPVHQGDAVPPLGLGALGGEAAPSLGDRPTVLFFWATDCPPCKRSIPALRRWAAAHNAQVIAVTNEPAATVAAFRDQWRAAGHPFPFPIALDRDDRAHDLFEVDATPVFIYVDERGRLAAEGEGFGKAIPLPDAP